MPPMTPPLDFDHKASEEIPTKHKEAIHQLRGVAKLPIEGLNPAISLANRQLVAFEATINALIARNYSLG